MEPLVSWKRALALPRWGALPGVMLVAAGVAAIGLVLVGPAGWQGDQVIASLVSYGVLAATVWILHGRQLGRATLGRANMVTLGRAGLTCLVGGTLLVGGGAATPAWSLVGLIALALALDALDGWLARRFEEVSAFGARFDLEVDALLLLILATLVWQTGRVEVWVLAIGLMRYAFVVAGRVWPWLRTPLPPSWRRKVVCAGQGVALWLALWPALGAAGATGLSAAAVLALIASFALDVVWLYRARVRAAPRHAALDRDLGCAILRPGGGSGP